MGPCLHHGMAKILMRRGHQQGVRPLPKRSKLVGGHRADMPDLKSLLRHSQELLQISLVLGRPHQVHAQPSAFEVHVLQCFQGKVKVLLLLDATEHDPCHGPFAFQCQCICLHQGHIECNVDARARKMGQDFTTFYLGAGMPTHFPKPSQRPSDTKKDPFFERLDRQGSGPQHAPRSQHQRNAECPCRHQRMQGKRHAEQAVEVHHVGAGRPFCAPQLVEPPLPRGRRPVGHHHAILLQRGVGLNALQRRIASQVAVAAHDLEVVVGLGPQKLHQIVHAADRSTRFVRRRVPLHHSQDPQRTAVCRCDGITQGHGVQGNRQAPPKTRPDSKTT